MGPAILGAAKGLSGLAGLLGIGSSVASNIGAKSRQNLANRQNVEFWNMQNKYNTPKAQMARLKDAGLNPALIYGSGATNTGVAGSIAPSKAASYNIKDPTPTALNAAMLGSQIRLQDSQSRKNNAETEKTLGLTPGLKTNLELRNEIQQIKNNIAGKTQQQAINLIKQSSLQADFNTKLKDVDAEAATGGYVKGNPFFTIFTQLGIAGDDPQSQLFRKALIGGLIGSKIISELSSGITKFIPRNPKTNR
jgi:hypothetical protein